MNNKYIKIIGNILTVSALVFVINRLTQMDIDYSILIQKNNIWWICLLSILYAVHILALPFSWRIIIEIVTKKKVDFWVTQNIFCKSNMLKYIPGNVFQYIGRNEIALRYNLQHKKIALTTILDIAANIIGVFLVAFICYSSGFEKSISGINVDSKVVTIIVVLGILCILGCTFILKWKYSLLIKTQNIFTWSNIKKYILCIVYYMFFAVYTGMIYLIIMIRIFDAPIKMDEVYIVVGAYLLSWLLGFLMPGAPGGVGVRETVITILLSDQFSVDLVLFAIVIYRIINTLGDVLALVVSHIICKNIVRLNHRKERHLV